MHDYHVAEEREFKNSVLRNRQRTIKCGGHACQCSGCKTSICSPAQRPSHHPDTPAGQEKGEGVSQHCRCGRYNHAVNPWYHKKFIGNLSSSRPECMPHNLARVHKLQMPLVCLTTAETQLKSDFTGPLATRVHLKCGCFFDPSLLRNAPDLVQVHCRKGHIALTHKFLSNCAELASNGVALRRWSLFSVRFNRRFQMGCISRGKLSVRACRSAAIHACVLRSKHLLSKGGTPHLSTVGSSKRNKNNPMGVLSGSEILQPVQLLHICRETLNQLAS